MRILLRLTAWLSAVLMLSAPAPAGIAADRAGRELFVTHPERADHQ